MSGIRIVAGAFKGRTLAVPDGETVRPTSDRTRQALFNRLEHSFGDIGFKLRGAEVADLFAGTGALGLEALSRGAAHVTFVELDPAARRALARNIEALGVEDRAVVVTADATALPNATRACSLVMMDPPYGQGLADTALTSLSQKGWLGDPAVVTVETDRLETVTPPAGLEVEDVRRYGKGAVTFLMRNDQAGS